MYEDELKHLSEKMDKSIQALRNEFTSIRTGQASPSLLDRVFVDYYGSKTPVTQVASVTVPEARMLVVQPWDKGILKDIEKAINMSELGLVPMNDGNLIRMAIPQLTEQRRKDLVKVVNKKAEEAKVAIRNIRRDGNVFLKKEEKNSDISKDVIKDMEDKIQKLTDQKIKDLEAVTDKKVKEILSVWEELFMQVCGLMKTWQSRFQRNILLGIFLKPAGAVMICIK